MDKWTVFTAARYEKGELIEDIDATLMSMPVHVMVYAEDAEDEIERLTKEVTELKTKLRDTTRSREELVIKADAIFDKNTALTC